MPKTNPYAAPESPMQVAQPPESGWVHHWVWLLVFSLNLPTCLMLGHSATNGQGMNGMIVGIVLMLAVGPLLRLNLAPLLKAINMGGLVTAVSQFMPIVQIIAGSLAMAVTRLEDNQNGMNQVVLTSSIPYQIQVALTTMMTGSLLMIVSAIIGSVMTGLAMIFRQTEPRPRRP